MTTRTAGRSWPVSLRTVAATLLLGAALTGCAHFSAPEPGASTAQVQSHMGAPLNVSTLPEGGQRWLYSTLPMGREVYHANFDAAGRLTSFNQVLDFLHLSRFPVGSTRHQVLDFFGPPYEITEVASFRGKVWTYRFMDDMNLRRLGHIHIGLDDRVAKVMFTDEPTADDFRAF
ncbi:hypothetical protein [Diaphorobacter aerolatus]|uniref:Outer membrane protein assembly factor BamE n=1 Tax=Diaphorobacter aerolatus TaxID=1288495 RepID=A0A7H0GGR3_9BURK|nr:hypothetical protein [Diaphorobacter aerolatus]QNP47479.1 hypothetical protein H9K75_14500 [Diaphorobacter aerolatus]